MPYACLERSNSRNIYYEDSGGPGPALVFSHGFLMDHTMFAPQVAALSDRYRCIVWDQRGHGLTATDRLDPFTYYDSANDLAELMDYLDVPQAVLFGMSQGGYLTLRAAITNPSIVTGLVLIDTQAAKMNADHLKGNEGLLVQWLKNGLTPDLATAIADEILLKGWPGADVWKQKWAEMKLVNLIASFNTLIDRDDISVDIMSIKQPALVMYGQYDAAVPFSAMQAMANALPNSQMFEVMGAGHASNLTNPAEANPAIEAFLQQLF